MKSPDEIKKGIAHCGSAISCYGCPYWDGDDCNGRMEKDAVAYIQQLEAERDAAVADMKNSRDCQCCKHYDVKWDEPCVHCDHDNNFFEWRGVQKEE